MRYCFCFSSWCVHVSSTDVLDESDPVLMNMNLVEAETAAKRMEAKKRVSSYNPYQDEEVDELGNVSPIHLIWGPSAVHKKL